MKKITVLIVAMIFAFSFSFSQTTSEVTFNVDISALVDSFDFANDTFFMAGDMSPVTSWEEPGTNMSLVMNDDDSDMIYSLTLTLDTGNIQFKFFHNPGWDGGEWVGDPNRMMHIDRDVTLNYTWGLDSIPTIVYPETVDVTFNVDISAMADSFDFANDTFFMAGDMSPVTSWEEPGTNMALMMSDDDSDMIYSLTLTLDTGDIAFKFFRNSGWDGGEWTGDPNRTAYITSNVSLNFIWGPETGFIENTLNKVSIYPNPTTGLVTISNVTNCTIQVIDITGNVIITANSKDKNKTLDISNLSKGIYNIRISDASNYISRQVVLSR